jgi:hypothetical protein
MFNFRFDFPRSTPSGPRANGKNDSAPSIRAVESRRTHAGDPAANPTTPEYLLAQGGKTGAEGAVGNGSAKRKTLGNAAEMVGARSTSTAREHDTRMDEFHKTCCLAVQNHMICLPDVIIISHGRGRKGKQKRLFTRSGVDFVIWKIKYFKFRWYTTYLKYALYNVFIEKKLKHLEGPLFVVSDNRKLSELCLLSESYPRKRFRLRVASNTTDSLLWSHSTAPVSPESTEVSSN